MSRSRGERSGAVAPPPAPLGNLRSATHGAFSARLCMPDADELVEIVYAHVPHLIEDDYLAVRDFAISQIRAWRLAAWLERNGDFDAKGRPRPALEHLRRWLDRAERARARLGLDPASRAALRVDESLVVQRVHEWAREDRTEGRQLRKEAAKRRGLTGGDGEHSSDG